MVPIRMKLESYKDDLFTIFTKIFAGETNIYRCLGLEEKLVPRDFHSKKSRKKTNIKRIRIRRKGVRRTTRKR